MKKVGRILKYLADYKGKIALYFFTNILAILLEEKSLIKNTIDSQFAKISRALDRYTYISAFEKNVKKIMDVLITDPYNTVSHEHKQEILQILEAVEKSVLSE